MSPKLQALIARAALGLLLVELPILTLELSKPDPDYRFLALGLLGGLAAFLEKALSPQLANTILPGAVVLPDTSGAVIALPDPTPATSHSPVLPTPAPLPQDTLPHG